MNSAWEENLPLVVICGRTNVGKSTLFNCLTEKRQALVSDIAGTTRDSNLGRVEWAKHAFRLVDTAGLIDSRALSRQKIPAADIDSQTQKQARHYLDQADLILFLVDAKAGLLPEDKALAGGLKKNSAYRGKTMLVANKIDNFRLAAEAAPFHKLGLGEPQVISAATGLGTGDLLDLVTQRLKRPKIKESAQENESEPVTSACIIGKPNVGKSSLLNAILGYERVIVSDSPHTTREPQDTLINYRGRPITLIDTAGISKQGRKSAGLEKYGIEKSLHSLNKADIALLVLDISEAIVHQDAKLVQEIVDRGKSLVLIANKWDRAKPRDPKKMTTAIYDQLPFATWAPIQFISAKTGEKVNKIMDLILAIGDQRKLTLSDSQCEKFMKAVIKVHKPAKGKGLRAPRLYEFRQIKSNPPIFRLRIGPDDDLHFSYLRFMINRLRERHGFIGTPIQIRVTKEKKSHTTYNK
ncbi:MAG: ribosome biogenesis GTPase Der [Patescibacteria group bacterium]